MKDEIHIEDLVPSLRDAVVKLKLQFLKKLLINTSGSKKPYLNKVFAKKLGVSWSEKAKLSSTIMHWFYGSANIRIKYLNKILKMSDRFSYRDVEKNLIFIRYRYNGEVYPNLPLKLDKSIGSIVGYILGDGFIGKKHLKVGFSNKNKELLLDFKEKMKRIFGINPNVSYEKITDDKTKYVEYVSSLEDIPEGATGRLFYPKIIGKILLTIFGKFSYGKSVKNITRNILKNNVQFKKSFIRAFFDSEGSIDPMSNDIEIPQKSKKVLENLSKLLIEFNIVPNRIIHDIRDQKELYHFTITGRYNLINFEKYIGFLSSRKVTRLRQLLIKVENSKRQTLRKGETKKLILELIRKNKSLNMSIIKTNLTKIYPEIKWSRSTIKTHLRDLRNKNLINKIYRGCKIVYLINNV